MKQHPVSREGWLYVAIFAGLAALAYWIWSWLIMLPGVLFLFVLFFLRKVPADELTLITPADGVVMERLGLMKFGSCTEIFVPTNVKIMVSPGDKVWGGLSVVGRVSVE